MFEQRFLTQQQYEDAKAKPIPDKGDLQPPEEDTQYPYFTSWIKQQVVDRLGGGQQGARRAFEGGLRIHTTIDGELQQTAQAAIRQWLPFQDGPHAALVAIENSTGKVRAMVGGDDDHYNDSPFNLATQGQRQPGSAIKPFILAEALKQGISPNSIWASHKLEINVPHSKEVFTVNNYEGAYSGQATLAHAITFSDNSVFAQVGIKVGTRKVARLARADGHPHARLTQLRDDARRPQAGRDPARHGPRVRDVRRRRRPHLRHAEPGRRQRARRDGARPGRHRPHHAPRRRQGRADQAPER